MRQTTLIEQSLTPNKTVICSNRANCKVLMLRNPGFACNNNNFEHEWVSKLVDVVLPLKTRHPAAITELITHV